VNTYASMFGLNELRLLTVFCLFTSEASVFPRKRFHEDLHSDIIYFLKLKTVV